MHELMRELYPVPRSLTGPGVRATFDVLERDVPLERSEVPTGARLFDWTVPREWTLRTAWLDGPDGRRIADLSESPLRVLAYSVPIRARMSLDELRPHLFSDPARPDVIPFRTSYHNENWGLCLRHRELEALTPGEYEVCIDADLGPGSLSYAEAVVRGTSDDEVLLSTYVDHPAQCNDNLSGIVLLAALARHLRSRPRPRLTYRFLWSPATLGPLAWLAANETRLDLVRHGLVACCVGDPGGMTYKRTRHGSADIDRAVQHVLRMAGEPHEVRDYSPLGGDERQFSSPGFDLPIGVLTRTPADEFPTYHSSADDLDSVRAEDLANSFARYVEVIAVLDGNARYVNLNPKGEPMLGKRGLYRSVGGGSFSEAPLLWVLNQSDGTHDLLAIAERSGLPFAVVRDAATTLAEHGLLAEA
jgi:aminopeptidase-like protein